MSGTSVIKLIRTDRSALKEISTRLGLRGKMDLQHVVKITEEIIKKVRQDGDRALLELTARYDKARLDAASLQVSQSELTEAVGKISPGLFQALEKAAGRIRDFHLAQLGEDVRLSTQGGSYISLVSRPLDTVGVYIPGGLAPLPSSVLMNIIPARAAGVRRVIMCTPPRADGTVDPVILAAAKMAGADAVYRLGGAQAVAALAYGTETVPAVDKITGPGNIYVNTAKRLVFGQVDIDMFAGPSEILVIADQTAEPVYVAADMLAQAEHDPLASALLVTDNAQLAKAVQIEIEKQLPWLPRREIIEKSLADYGAILLVPDLATAVDFANELAPEHLELLVLDPSAWLPRIRNAGAVFVGHYSPESLGDYLAGTNHVLPTSGTARFFSALNTHDFMKKHSVIHYTEKDLADCQAAIVELAEAEQLKAHAEAVRVRFGNAAVQKGDGLNE